MKIGIFVVLFLIFSVLQYVDTAFQCYQCSDCGSNWDPNRARVVLTEAGSNVCVKRVNNGHVSKGYELSCPQSTGIYCCQGDLCNSTNSKYRMDFVLLTIGMIFVLLACRQ